MTSLPAVAVLLCLAAASVVAKDSAPDLCIAGGWVLQEQCSLSPGPQARGSSCCSTLKGLQGLGCFCNDGARRLTQSLDLKHLSESCGLDLGAKSSKSCQSETSVVDILEDSSANILEDFTEAAMVDTAIGNIKQEVIDNRPILDLSSMPETVTTIFRKSDDGQVTISYTESVDGSGESTLRLNLEVPEAADVDVDVDVDLEYQLLNEDPDYEEAIMDLGLGEPKSSSKEEVGDVKSGRPCQHHSDDSISKEEESIELNVQVPEGFFMAFNDSDVTIDMDYDPAVGGSFSSAAITLDDDVLESSFTGQAIGRLLEDAASYLSSEFSIPISRAFVQSHSDASSVQQTETSVITGALNFLAAVGEDIRDSIPNKALHDGDVIQIQHEEDTMPGQALNIGGSNQELVQRPMRKSLVKISEDIWSDALRKGSQKQVAWMYSCSMCAIVQRYTAVLWGVVLAGALMLVYCAVSAAVAATRGGAPTDPNTELKQPLIVCAADFIKSSEESTALMLPVWSPPKALP